MFLLGIVCSMHPVETVSFCLNRFFCEESNSKCLKPAGSNMRELISNAFVDAVDMAGAAESAYNAFPLDLNFVNALSSLFDSAASSAGIIRGQYFLSP